MAEEGIIYRISGPVVIAHELESPKMYDVVKVGKMQLVGEIIKIKEGDAIIQVYEDTSGLRPGEPVENTHRQLSVMLAPGIIGSIYDGIQRPLDKIKASSGDFIARGVNAEAVDTKRKWHFVPVAKNGAEVKSGDIIGEVQETGLIKHKVMVPIGLKGAITGLKEGDYTIMEKIAAVGDAGSKSDISMLQYWPVRIARPVMEKLPPRVPLITGQRVIDTFFPVAQGGTAAVPGPFGSGKCVTGDTPILLGDGSVKPIGELYRESVKNGLRIQYNNEEYVTLQKPLELLSFHGMRIQKSTSSVLYKGRSDSVIRIRTRTGREVRVTPIHKLFKLNGNGKIEETEARRLSPGDYIVSARKTAINNENSTIDVYMLDEARVLDEEIRDRLAGLLKSSILKNVEISIPEVIRYSLTRSDRRVAPKLSWVKEVFTLAGEPLPRPRLLTGGRKSTPVHIPEIVTNDLAEFLGYYISEGCVREEETVVFTNSEESLLYRFSELAYSLFGITGSREVQKDKTPNVLLHSRILARFLEALEVGRNASEKRVPDILLSSSDSALSAFLASYFIGDGSFSKNCVELTTASRWLSIQLSYILTRFGIINTRSHRDVNGERHYRIFVSGKTAIGALSGVLRSEHAKILKMSEYANSGMPTYNPIDIVPLSPEYVGGLYKKHTHYSELPEAGIEISNYTGSREHMGSKTFVRFQKVIATSSGSQMLEASIQTVAESLDHIYFDRISQVEEELGPFDVYDVSVPEFGSNFVGGYGGILLHNTVIQHQLAKWSESDMVVYVGCGERGNEMTEILTTFPNLKDPNTGKPLMDRTILIANTSNMPVAAREASIYTGITLAEYYRDMGYNVALMADSTSRWAEALREISGRLEEMPGEEGYPAYLGRKVAEFYERAGMVKVLNGEAGSITAIGAVSPPGGDISEPVSQNTLRVTRVFWALDASLANRRHFPSINWLNSYSLYMDDLGEWYGKNVGKEWVQLRAEMMGILQKEAEINEVVQLVGYDALPEREKETLDIAKSIREDYLQQSAFDDVDTYTSMKKQYAMLKSIKMLHDAELKAVERGVMVEQMQKTKAKEKIARMKFVKESDMDAYFKELGDSLAEFESIESGSK